MLRSCSFRFIIQQHHQSSSRKVPSLIAMLSNKASTINLTPEQKEQRNLMKQQKEEQEIHRQHSIAPTHPDNSNTDIIDESSASSTPPTLSEEKSIQQQSQKKKPLSNSPVAILADLSLLKTNFSQEETNRRSMIEKYKVSLSTIDVQLQEINQFTQITTDEEEAMHEKQRAMLLRAKYNIKRKLNRCQVATAEQRRILLHVVRYLKSRNVRLSLEELSDQIQQHHHQRKDSASSSSSETTIDHRNTARALSNFIDGLGFFSGALRKVQKMVSYQQQQQQQEAHIHVDQRRASKNVSLLGEGSVALMAPKLKKQIRNLLCDLLAVSNNNNNNETKDHQTTSPVKEEQDIKILLRPKEAIALLFSATKSGLLYSPNQARIGNKEKQLVAGIRVTAELLSKTILSFHPASFSAWDTLQVTMWLSAMMIHLVRISSSSSSSTTLIILHAKLAPLLLKLYKDLLLKHLWIQNASGLRGISAWLVLSCIPELDESYHQYLRLQTQRRRHYSSLENKKQQQQQEDMSTMKNLVVARLIPECTKMLSAPLTANQFAQPWDTEKNKKSPAGAARTITGSLMRSESLNNLQDDDIFGVKPARVNSIENELSAKIGINHPQRLMSVLTLINSDSMRKLSIEAERAQRRTFKAKIEKNFTEGKSEEESRRDIVRTLALPSQLSLGRAVVYGALARTLRLFSNIQHHVEFVPDTSLLLLVASGPAIENSSLDSKVEAASVSNLIDSIYVQLYQICEAILEDHDDDSASSTTDDKYYNGQDDSEMTRRNSLASKKTRNKRKIAVKKISLNSDAQKQEVAMALVRGLTCLAHLSTRGFLAGKRKFERFGGSTDDSSNRGGYALNDSSSDQFLSNLRRNGSEFGRQGDVPVAKSRILSELPGIGSTSNVFATSAHSKKDRRQLQLIFSKDQILTRFFRALTVSELILSLPSVGAVDTLEKAMYSLGGLTSARSKEIMLAREIIGSSRGSSSSSKLFASSSSASSSMKDDEDAVSESEDEDTDKNDESTQKKQQSPEQVVVRRVQLSTSDTNNKNKKKTAKDALRFMQERQMASARVNSSK